MKVYLMFLFGLITAIGSAQQAFTDSVIKPLQNNQLLFEKAFIHTNKTSYFIDDVIWFKAYVGDTDNRPSLKTTRLSVNLLDSEGKIVQEGSVFIYKGVGKGQFFLDDSLKSGEYYIEAYTNFMKNFGSNNTAIQKIKILNKVPTKSNLVANTYDIQIFPEGGYLLENTENVIGIKGLINGKGFDYSGKIVNSKNEKITSFKSEHLGMTKCKFIYLSDEKYTAVFTINDTIKKVAIPTAKKSGVVLTVDNTKIDYLSLTVKTNNNSLADSTESNYTLLFHQKNKVIDFYKIATLDATNLNLVFDKNDFYNGVNTVTLFKDNQPITERKFYIEKPAEEISLSLKRRNIENDSINYKLKITSIKSNTPIKANLSVAVLPINSVNFNEFSNIKSSFLLSPYLKGYIENPAYYFEKDNSKRQQYLDLLLLTQGWTQYSLEEMINNLNPSYKYDFELGYKLKGTVSPLLTNDLALLTNENVLIDKLPLNGKKHFSFNNLLIYKGDAVKISFVNQLNEAIKPETLSFDAVEMSSIGKFNNENIGNNNKAENWAPNLWEESYYSSSIKLDEIIVNATTKSANYYNRQRLVKKYKTLVFDIGKYYPIEIPDNQRKKNDGLLSFLNFDQNVKLVSLNESDSYLEVGVGKTAKLYVDGKPIVNGGLFSLYLGINDVENIMVQPDGGNMSYQVFTTENYKKNVEELFKNFVFEEGFDRDKKYYSPLYDFDTNVHLNWVEIDWKPDLTTNEQGEVDIRIKQNKGLDGYLFSIQGFSGEGVLISTVLKENDLGVK